MRRLRLGPKLRIAICARTRASRPATPSVLLGLKGLEKQCTSMSVQFSTGGESSAGQARHGMLPLRPDMARLSVGSNNFSTQVYENLPDLVDRLAAAILKYGVEPEVEAFALSNILR